MGKGEESRRGRIRRAQVKATKKGREERGSANIFFYCWPPALPLSFRPRHFLPLDSRFSVLVLLSFRGHEFRRRIDVLRRKRVGRSLRSRCCCCCCCCCHRRRRRRRRRFFRPLPSSPSSPSSSSSTSKPVGADSLLLHSGAAGLTAAVVTGSGAEATGGFQKGRKEQRRGKKLRSASRGTMNALHLNCG